MNDRRAHFLTLTGDACVAAGLANIDVELLLADGTTTTGVPSPLSRDEGHGALDQTGYANQLSLDGHGVLLEDIVGFVIRSP